MKHHVTTFFARGAYALGLLIAAVQLHGMPQNLVGSYRADLAEETTVRGQLEVTLNAKGLATGKATMPNGKSYGFRFQLSQVGDGVVAPQQTIFNKKGQTVTLTDFAVNGEGELSASFESNISGIPPQLMTLNGLLLASYSGRAGNVAPWTGRTYTMAMTRSAEAGDEVPVGAGYTTFLISPNGKLAYKGKLGDGTKLTGTAFPDVNGVYALFRTVYTPGGLFVARLFLESLGLQEDQGYWNKPENQKDKKYKGGFSTALDVEVREWTKLAKRAVPGADIGFGVSKNFTVDFSGDGLSGADFDTTLPDTARFTTTGVVQAVAGGAGAPGENVSKDWNKLWSVKVNAKTGEFTGTQVLKTTVGSKTKSKKINLSGVLLLGDELGDMPFALGQYLVTPTGGTEISGEVSFSGPLEDNLAVAMSGTYVTYGLLAMPDASKPVNSKEPVLPKGAPKLTYRVSVDNTSERVGIGKVTLVIAEDRQSVKVNNVKLNLISNVQGILDFSSVSGGVSRTLKLQTNLVTGEVEGYILVYQQFYPGRLATYTCRPAGPDDDQEEYASITKQ